MKEPGIRITTLPDSGDARGASFPAGADWARFLGAVEDTHITTVLPGATRASHYHLRKREVLMVLFQDAWRLACDHGAGTVAGKHDFNGTGALIVEIEPMASHAVINTGGVPLWVIGFSDTKWEQGGNDAVPSDIASRA